MKRSGAKRRTPWSMMDLVSQWFYGLLRRSFLGRWLTAYRRMDRRMRGGDTGTGDRPLSGWRQTMVRIMENGPVVRALKLTAQVLFDIPVMLIGLFGAVYGLAGAGGLLLYNVYLLSIHVTEMDLSGFLRYGVILLLSTPLLFSRRPLSETLYRCSLTRVLLIWLLGVPKDRFFRPTRSAWRGLPVIAALLALLTGAWSSQLARFEFFAAIPSQWYPFLVPLSIFVMALICMIITVPETGVVLSCCCLALLWVQADWPVILLISLILTTWIGYVIQILQAHRTIRFELLDRVVLLFAAVLLFGGIVGYGTGAASMQRAVVLTVLLSLYFPIVNLMVTKTHVKRCWVGLCLMAAMVTVSVPMRWVDPEELRWLEMVWPKMGPVLADEFAGAVQWLTAGSIDWQILLLVLIVPLLLAFMLRSNRLLFRVIMAVLMAADVALIATSGSRGACLALLACGLIFCFLGHHRALTVSMFATPVAVGAWLCIPLLPESMTGWYRQAEAWLSSWDGLTASRYGAGVWRMVRTHPAGIGLGEGAFEMLYPLYATAAERPNGGSGSLYLDVLATLGIPGLIVFAAVVLLFVQKSLTSLRYCGGRADRLLILGGLGGLSGVLLLGAARSLSGGVTVFFVFWTVLAVLSAYENVLERETEALQARSMENAVGRDYIGRIN